MRVAHEEHEVERGWQSGKEPGLGSGVHRVQRHNPRQPGWIEERLTFMAAVALRVERVPGAAGGI